MKSTHPSEIIKDIKPSDLKGLNAVFVNMPIREAAAPTTTPEGPLLLGTRLRDQYGVNVSMVDLNGYRIKDSNAAQKGFYHGRHVSEKEAYNLFKDHVREYGTPDFVGLSGIITTLGWQERMAKIVREVSPNAFLVSGGGLATELGAGLFNYIPELNGVSQGEGDDVVVKIAADAALVRDKGLEGAVSSGRLGPYYTRRVDGKHGLVYVGARPLDLNKLPSADLDLLNETRQQDWNVLEYYLGNAVWGKAANNSSAAPFTMNRSTTFVSSRGCPHFCDFCYKGAQGDRNYGMRSAENVAQEFKSHIQKYGVDFIGLPDDNFAVNRKRIRELVSLLKPLNIRWGTHMRMDEAADIKNIEDGRVVFNEPKKVEMMADAGCVYVGFGAESASPRVLESMKKGGFILRNGMEDVIVNGTKFSFPRSMIYGVKNSEEVGVHSNCTWIMGYPGETLEDLKTSVAFIKWQEEYYGARGKGDSVNKKMFTATAYPGTPMFSRQDVKQKLSGNFGISFDGNGRPICDKRFRDYILGLEDATKVLVDGNGHPLNYSKMDDETFLRAREYIDKGEIEKVLDM